MVIKWHFDLLVVTELPVNISASPGEPESGFYQVGSSLTLTCQTQGGHSPFTYNWNSTCNDFCFASGETSNSITSGALHSIDGGSHTCLVTDYTGRFGRDTVEIALSGLK